MGFDVRGGGGCVVHGTYREPPGMDHPATTPPPSLAHARVRDGDDAALVAAVRAGDGRAFERLYARHQPQVAAQVRAMLHDPVRAEDVTQEVFLSALRRMRETDAPIAFGAWLREIARNACIDHFRRARRRPELSYDDEGGLGAADRGRLVDAGAAPDAAVVQKEALGDLRGAFDELSDTHHQILVLRELEGLSYREIGERLGLGRSQVESTLFRARRRLAEEYEELTTGARCLRVRGIIATAAQGPVGVRDERRLARHVARCAGCRREAWAAGVATPPRPARRRIGALLPLPAFLRRLVGWRPSHGGGAVAASQLGARLDPEVATWAKAAAAAAAMALTGVGAGEVLRQGPGPQPAVAAGGPHGGGGGRAGTAGGVGGSGGGVPGAARAAAPSRATATAPRAGGGRVVTGHGGGRAVSITGGTASPVTAPPAGGAPVAGGGAPAPASAPAATPLPVLSTPAPASATLPSVSAPVHPPAPSVPSAVAPASGATQPAVGATTKPVGPVAQPVTKPVAPAVEAATKPVAPVVQAATNPVAPVVQAATKPVAPVVQAATKPVAPVVQAAT
ncbi:MAG: hypothetical protein QOH43_4271, partial [Solirubrobacteraceae bacterium]|nr:hypothetical protein [Solirubrobacteraceae bacterium]